LALSTSQSSEQQTLVGEAHRKRTLALRINDIAQYISVLIGVVSQYAGAQQQGVCSMELDLLGTCSNSLRRALLSFIVYSNKVSANTNNHVMRDEQERAARDLLLRALDVVDLTNIILANSRQPTLGSTSTEGVGLRVFLHTANQLADSFEDLLQRATESNTKTMSSILNAFAQRMSSFHAMMHQFGVNNLNAEGADLVRLILALVSSINQKAVAEPPSLAPPDSKRRGSRLPPSIAPKSQAYSHANDDEEMVRKEIERTRERLSDFLLNSVLGVHRQLNSANAFVLNLSWLIKEGQTHIQSALVAVCPQSLLHAETTLLPAAIDYWPTDARIIML
jgi:hypothetical protein